MKIDENGGNAMKKKILIVGGVAGGASTAARLRRLDEEAEIIMFERDEYISFANCGLPYYIGEIIEDRDDLLIQTPESMKERFNIDVRVFSEVISVNSKDKRVTVKTKNGESYEESYDFLVLSPGAKALRPNIPGINSEKILTLRNVSDTDKIKAFVDTSNIKNALVIGGGYVGVEMAENLIERGLQVKLVEAAPHILAPFDSEMVAMAEEEMEKHGIELHLGDGVKAFEENGNIVEVQLNSGNKVEGDLVILAIGVAPDVEFLKDSGLEFGPRGHILTNDRMMTNADGIYAVGDAVEVVDFINGQKTAIPLAGPANKQGRIAADNICGIDSRYKGTQGTSVIKIFDLTGAGTGNNERTLQRLNIPYKVVYIHPQSHASYYPGASAITLKLIFNNEGKILGAQAFGREGVEKRIDVIATAIKYVGNVKDLTELELSYAPPYSSAKDPVNMAGYVAENVLKGNLEVFVPREIENYSSEKAQLVDVRTGAEYDMGHIEGSIDIPVDEIRGRLNEFDKNKEVWLYCQVGLRGYIASRILTQQGFKVKNMTGGYKLYSVANFTPKKNTSSSSNGIVDPVAQINSDKDVAVDKN
jgi:CoA-disulfide reductase